MPQKRKDFLFSTKDSLFFSEEPGAPKFIAYFAFSPGL